MRDVAARNRDVDGRVRGMLLLVPVSPVETADSLSDVGLSAGEGCS